MTKSQCQYVAGVCSQCGQKKRDDVRRSCPAYIPGELPSFDGSPPAKIDDCPHFLGSTGETIRAFGCGCAADKGNGVPVTVCECELHGRCIVFARGTHLSDETVRRCATCGDNPANQKTIRQKTGIDLMLPAERS